MLSPPLYDQPPTAAVVQQPSQTETVAVDRVAAINQPVELAAEQGLVQQEAADEQSQAEESEATGTEGMRQVPEAADQVEAEQQEQQRHQLIQNLIEIAHRYLEHSEFDQSQRVARSSVLPTETQAELLQQIDAAAAAAEDGAHVSMGTVRSLVLMTAPLPGQSITTQKSEHASKKRATVKSNINAKPVTRTYTATPTVQQVPLALRVPLVRSSLPLIFPLAIAAPMTSPFGWRIHPVTGESKFHDGIDLGAPYGSTVIAAHDGQVISADWLGGYGMAIVLRYRNGTQETLYGHLSQILVQPGQWVPKGQPIGLVGSTGNSTGPHLHFELRQNTTQGWIAIDPAAALNQEIPIAQTLNTSLRTFNIQKLYRQRKTLPFARAAMLKLPQSARRRAKTKPYDEEHLADMNGALTRLSAYFFPNATKTGRFGSTVTVAPLSAWSINPFLVMLLQPPISEQPATKLQTEDLTKFLLSMMQTIGFNSLPAKLNS